MPRIYDELWEPFDLCQDCYDAAISESHFRDASDFDADHPPYENTNYQCDYCHKPLTENDNYEKD